MNAEDLRKAAILVSVLDTASADALLEQMGPMADRVRAAVMNLDKVSEAEQATVIQEFLGMGNGGRSKGSQSLDNGVTWDLPDPDSLPPPPSKPINDTPTRPFAFLLEADPVPLSEQLQKESPQITAVVLAHLPAELAAQVLQYLPTGMASDVLVRIAHLDDMSSEVLGDIEHQLRASLDPYLRSKKSRQNGAARVGAILQSLPRNARGQLEDAISARDRHLLAAESRGTKTASKPKLRIAPETIDDDDIVTASRSTGSSKNKSTAAAKSGSQPQLRIYPPSRPAPHFSQLATLNDADWQKLLEVADADLILLAFAGAEPQLINRLLRGFSKKEAEYWRKQFANPGPVRVRDIDAAQERLAQLAAELTDEGILNWPAFKRLSALA